MQQPTQPDQYGRQRNKLHKPGDPRAHHQYSDSGVGMADTEPIQSSRASKPAHSNWIGPDEAVGGGTYTREYAQPSAPLESIRTELDTSTPTDETENYALSSNDRKKDLAAGSGASVGVGAMGLEGVAESRGRENIETTSGSHQPSGSTAPYWGNIPKDTDRGVYNTVTGHGSALDDHDEHHHLPPKSASPDRAVIAGSVANYPRGGVYNTVAGHGSQVRSNDDGIRTNMAAAAAAGDTMLAAPLPDIPEESQRAGRSAAFANSSNTGSGFQPETAVSQDAGPSQFTPKPNHDMTSQRAFPLSTAPAESHNGQRESTSPSRHGAATGAAAGAVGLGAGIAASDYAGKRRKGDTATAADQNTRQSQSQSPSLDNRHQTLDDQTLGNRHQTVGGVATGKQQSSRHRSPPTERRSHEEESPRSDKKHKILGIFHRSKDNGKEDTAEHRRRSAGEYTEPPKESLAAVNTPNRLRKQSRGEAAMERRRSPSAARADTDRHSGHGMEKTAAGAAAGAGAFGLLHHNKNSTNDREQPQSTTEPTRGPLSADSGGVGAAGEAPHQVEQVSTPFEHPREPPVLPQGADASQAAGPGQHSHYGMLAGGIPSSTSHGTTTNEPGHYNTLASGVPSGIKQDPATNPSMAGDDKAEYNVLPSGTPSGVKVKPKSPRHSGHHTGAALHANNEAGHGQYNNQDNHQPQPPTDITSRAQDLKDSPMPGTQHHTFLAGGPIPSHVRGTQAQPSTAGQPSGPEMAHNMSPEVMPAAYTQSAPHASQGGGRQNQGQDYATEQYPPQPQMAQGMSPAGGGQGYSTEQYPPQHQMAAQGMSPAVMPDAYTASAPRPTQGQGQDQGGQGYSTEQHPPQRQMAQGMSPAVMPDAYTAAAAPARSSSAAHTAVQQQQHRDPALAAATSSWATSAGKSSGVGHNGAGSSQGNGMGMGQGQMKCQHCGGENDISGYLERFTQEAGFGKKV
ncbi:hypothetical protein C8A00DRAFT_14103 [Chaetomidium leptoderma]|uniref:Uncharacterized protein n=1 Tax=Chaetomidium leptoderma TaxID=669021 RepID=A0AAN6ZYE1_9PEZI|nr:hypothetical protein C8A00DRAFT_14103 [Chaetomidium leptoderma]